MEGGRDGSARRFAYSSQFTIHNSYFIILCALCFGCGVAGQPHPPRVERPEAVTDLAMMQKGPAFVLSFTPPRRAVDGQRLTKPLEIELFRAITNPGEKVPASLAAAAPSRTVPADDLARHTSGDKAVLSERLSDSELAQYQGATITFALRGLTFGFRHRRLDSELSNLARGMLLDVSGPVEDLQIKTTENALELRWTAPERSLSGRPLSDLAGYRVYRSETGKPGTFQVRRETISAAYSDSDFAFDHTYFYKVCARFRQAAQVAESEDSAVVEITPRDTFPPAAPKNVSGLFSADAVQLVWTANTEPDLAGYNVYRREGEAAWRKLNSDALRTPTFEDRSVQPGHQYLYRVTAVDLAHNESAPSEETAVETGN